jgi:hypothetical protein
MKYMKLNHILILQVDSNIEYFTSHGLHLNGLDKGAICTQIVLTIEKILQIKEDEHVSID